MADGRCSALFSRRGQKTHTFLCYVKTAVQLLYLRWLVNPLSVLVTPCDQDCLTGTRGIYIGLPREYTDGPQLRSHSKAVIFDLAPQ